MKKSKSLLRIRSRSFTLIEILVATTIFMVVSVIALAVITSVINSSAKTQAVLNVQESGRLAMEMMANQIKKAQNVIRPANYPTGLLGNILSIDDRSFGLYDNNNNVVRDYVCPSPAAQRPCYLGVGSPSQRLTPPTINVERLEFLSGGNFTGSNSTWFQIKMTVQTKSMTNVKEKQTVELQTSVVPFYQDDLEPGWSYDQ